MLSKTRAYLRNLTKAQLILFCLLAGAGYATLSVGARTWLPSKGVSSNTHTPVTEGVTPDSLHILTQPDIKVELITLKKWGFEPNEITRPKGRFLLFVNNQSQLIEQLTFSLVEETGNKLKEERMDYRGKHRWNNLFDLHPGNYQLRVSEHPEWVCRFTVTN